MAIFMPSRYRRAVLAAALALTCMCAAGCGTSGVYDPSALANARSLAVLPTVAPPGTDGKRVGPVHAGLVIGALADTGRFRVEGPGRLRKAMDKRTAKGQTVFSSKLQAELAKELDIDLFVLAELTDFRYTKKRRSTSLILGSISKTESTYWVGVAIRLIEPAGGKLVYSARAVASSKQGYGPAIAAATDSALADMKKFLAAKAGTGRANR